jgi:hypothetical protein
MGRYLIALVTNEEAVRLSGIDLRPIKVVVFIDQRHSLWARCRRLLCTLSVGRLERGQWI